MKIRTNHLCTRRIWPGCLGEIEITTILLFCFCFPAQAVTFTVTNLNDSGTGSLRQTVLEANAATATNNTIVFQAGLSGILLTSGGFTITGNLTINGPGENVLTISDNNSQRVFVVDSGATATISRLTIKNGSLYNYYSTLTINYSTLSDSTIGRIYNRNGTLTVSNSTLSSNSATRGGGIYNRDSARACPQLSQMTVEAR